MRLTLAAGVILALAALTIYLLPNDKGATEPTVFRIQHWIETDPRIGGICLSEDDTTLYAGYKNAPDQFHLQQIDVETGKVLDSIVFTPESDEKGNSLTHDHFDVVLSGDGQYLLTTNYYFEYISKIDLTGDRTPREVRIIGDNKRRDDGWCWACGIGIAPDKKRLVVTMGQDGKIVDEHNDQVSILEWRDGGPRLVAEVPLDDEPVGHKIGFSADSRFAYVVTRARGSDSARLYEIRLAPPFDKANLEERSRVGRHLDFPGGQLASVAVSSEPEWLLVSDRLQRKVHAVDRESFEIVRSFDVEGHAPDTLAIHPQGHVLAVLCPVARILYFINAYNGTVLGKVPGLRDQCLDVEFSHDGGRLFVSSEGPKGGIAIIDLARLVFASNRGGASYQIFAMGIGDDKPVALTNNRGSNVCPRWSPDGTRIAFLSDRDGRPRICLLDLTTQSESSLTQTNPVDPTLVPNSNGIVLDWSPSGREIAFVQHDLKVICVVDIASGEVGRLCDKSQMPAAYAKFSNLCWAPDDNIYFTCENPAWGNDRDLFRLQVAREPKPGAATLSVSVAQLTQEVGEPSWCAPTVARRKGRLAALFQRTTHGRRIAVLWRSDATDSLPWPREQWAPVTLEEITTPRCPQWFPDGKRIVFSSEVDGQQRLHVANVQSKRLLRLTADGWEEPAEAGPESNAGQNVWNDIQPDIYSGFPELPSPPRPQP